MVKSNAVQLNYLDLFNAFLLNANETIIRRAESDW